MYILRLIVAAVIILNGGMLSASAQDYPIKGRTIRIVVSYPPGAANDILARIIAQKLSERWGTPVIVDNKPGANGIIGGGSVATAAPDGYTLWLGTDGPIAINKTLYKSLPYNPVTDFAPLTLLARYQLVLITAPSLKVNSVAEFVEAAKKAPEKLNYGSPGLGSQHHLAMELLSSITGIKLLHVPYRGSAPALTAMLADEVQAQFQGTAVVQPYIPTGNVKALAVSSSVRSPVVPELPTLAEGGVPGFDISVWFGLLAPAGTPPAIVEKLNREVTAIVHMPDVRRQMLAQGLEPDTNTPTEFADMIKSEIVRWAKILEIAKVQPIE